MSERFDVWVTTKFYHPDGRLFCDLGTFVWPRVSDDMRVWLAGSCKKTAFWLIDLDACPGGYTLEYHTVVRRAGEEAIYSEVGPVRLEEIAYADVLRFEKWALGELDEMIGLFAAEHDAPPLPTKRRSKLRTILQVVGRLLHDRFFRGTA